MKKSIKNVIQSIIIIVIILTMVMTPVLTALADTTKIVTLGANLSEEQRNLILNYFGVNENEVDIIEVTNEDEHKYLDDIATPGQIGSRTFSCAYIEPTTSGGIHVKTVNLTWVTCDMIRNALITSGINNCNVIAAAPIQVSGTGSLTGIFKAYEMSGHEQLSEEKIEIASEELITTMDIAEEVGQDEASSMISTLKSLIITENIDNENDILKYIEQYIKDNKIELTEEQKWALVELLLKISKQDYDIEEIKKAYTDVKQAVEFIQETSDEAKPYIDKFKEWAITSWQKITGTYEEIKESEEYEQIKEQLGIIAETNDSLLSDSTLVTSTDELTNELLNDNTEVNSESTDENIIDSIVKFFKNLLNKDKQNIELNNQVEEDEVTFEKFSNIQEDIEIHNEVIENEQDEGILDKITYEVQNEINNEAQNNNNDASTGISFDELTK